MAVSSNRRSALVFALLAGCSVGVGDGEASGVVSAPGCGLDDTAFDLQPNFFIADDFEGRLELRIQSGGDFEYLSDGITLMVADTSAEIARLGEPVTLSAAETAPVRMNIYLNHTCTFDRGVQPVNYIADSGTITFFSLYSPDESSQRLNEAEFQDVHFVDPSSPDDRHATLSGRFSFLYNRGRPAQRFP